MPRVAAVSDDPAILWSALAPLLAGQPRVRISRDAGRSYPQRFERDLTDALPSQPAAVRIFGKDGTCRAIFLDFDASVDGPDRVLSDVRLVTTWLHSHGARWIEDYSPNGGRHVYVPLAQRVTFSEARDLVEALGTRYRSLDRSPHQNINHGCMRTPGSVHKRGGHQLLAMSLPMAYDIVRRPNDSSIWKRLTKDLAEEMAAARATRLEESYAPTVGDAAEETVSQKGRGMSRAMQSIALHGIFDTSRYPSPSEARLAVLLAAAAAGHTLFDVERRIKQGIWPGLAQFYARYRTHHRFKTLKHEWDIALRRLREQDSRKAPNTNDHKSTTSQPPTQPGVLRGSIERDSQSEHRFIRTWRNALRLVEGRYQDSRAGMAQRMILRAIGEAAHKSGSRFIEFGIRSLALASGIDHTTVSAHLRTLRQEPERLITLVEGGRGTHGDLYMLEIPVSLQEAAESARWPKGKIHALRPAFRELGFPAAFLYEALEHSRTPLSTAELTRITGLSRTAASAALQILAAWNLVERSGPCQEWRVVSTTSLALLAEHFGVMEDFARRLRRYRAERAAWRSWLARHTLSVQMLLSPEEDYPWEIFEGPPDEVTLADLAHGFRT